MAIKVTLWDMASGRLIALDDGTEPHFATAAVWSLGFSRDGGTLAVGDERTATFMLWDVVTRSLRAKLRGHSKGQWSPMAVAFGPGRDQVISMGTPPGVPKVPFLIFPDHPPADSAYWGRERVSREFPPSEVIVWDVPSPTGPRVTLRGEAWPLFSPDGQDPGDDNGPRGRHTEGDVSAK